MIRDIFPKGFFSGFDIPNFDELLDFCSTQKNHDNDRWNWTKDCKVDTITISAKDALPVISPTLKKFSEIINFDFNCTSTDPWLNNYKRHSYQEVHNHSEHDFSAVFFMNEGEGFSNFFFYDSPNMGNLRWSKIRKEMGYSNYSFESKKGKVLIFPGWMDHGVTPHGSDSIRTTLACNFDFQFN